MILLILALAFVTDAAPVTVKDLQSEWMIYDGHAYRAWTTEQATGASTIYFPLDTRKFGGQYLLVRCPGTTHLFVDGGLIAAVQDSALLALDDLRTEFGEQVFVGIHGTDNLEHLETRIVSIRETRAAQFPSLVPRPPVFFRDFGIVATFIIVCFLLVLFRVNPQLTLDYFSFSKVFSSTERNETQLASRITSSENLLFYVFSALLMGFLLSIILYSAGPEFMAARPLAFTSLLSSLLIWMELSLFILLLLAGKLVIVLLFSTLYNFRETVSFQFFNFLRFVLFTSVVLSVISVIYFVFQVRTPAWYERLIALGLLMLTMGSMVVFLKLLGRLRFSLFHLFSYLCISEFIPLVILFKIFF